MGVYIEETQRDQAEEVAESNARGRSTQRGTTQWEMEVADLILEAVARCAGAERQAPQSDDHQPSAPYSGYSDRYECDGDGSADNVARAARDPEGTKRAGDAYVRACVTNVPGTR